MLKIAKSLITIAAVAAIAVGATGAYFYDSDVSADNSFQTGTLSISVDQSMQTISPVINNWAPGEETPVRFDVLNTGTLPVNLAAYAVGSWNVPSLNDNYVKVTKVEVWNGSAWQTISSNPAGITGVVYYSPDGTNSALWEVAGGNRAYIQLTVLFDSSADNSYEAQTYTAQIHVGAKQIAAPTFAAF